MNMSLIFKLRSLVQALGAQSVSIGSGPQQAVLTCIPTHLNALEDLPGLIQRNLEPDFLAAGHLESAQILWAGPERMGRIISTPESGWSIDEYHLGAYNPVFSILLCGETIDTTGWAYAFDVETVYQNGFQVETGLNFSAGGLTGQVVHDDSLDYLSLAIAGQITAFRQACHLIAWVRDGSTIKGAPIPDPQRFMQELVNSMRQRYLKTDLDFTAGQVRSAVDLESLKAAAEHPQDLAALLGLGLHLKPNLERQEIGWEVERYLLQPVVLDGYDATACIEANLPIAPVEFAPDWTPMVVPSISETLPKKLLKKSDYLAIFMVEKISAGDLVLPYLLVQPGCKLTAGGEELSLNRPLLLLARSGRKAGGIVGDLAARTLFLGVLLRLFGEFGTLERQRVLLERYPFRFDPLLAALWLVGSAVNLTRGEASSIGHLKKSALSFSLATAAEIEAVRKKKPDPSADQALAQALEALHTKREKLLRRLAKAAKVG